MENSKIVLYKERDFGEVFNAAFAFIRQEFKPLGKAILALILPFLLLQGIILAIYQSSMMSFLKNVDFIRNDFGNFFGTFMGNYLLIVLIILLTHTMIFSVVVSYFRLYQQGIKEITISALLEEVIKCFVLVFLALIFSYVIFFIGFVLCILPGIYLGVSLSLFIIALIFEKRGFFTAFSRSFELVHMQWWWTFLIIFVIGIIMYLIIFILQIPMMIFGFANVFHRIQENNFTNPYEFISTGYIIYSSIISVIQYVLYIVPIIILSFHYFSLVEIREKPSLNQEINNIGQND